MRLRNASILIVDDDPDVLTALGMLLKKEALQVVTEKNPENLPTALRRQHFDLLLLDMNFNASVNTGNEGFFWLRQARSISPSTSVMMITAYADIDLAIRSLKEGASDFVVKPWNNQRMLQSIEECLAQKSPGSSKTSSAQPFEELGLLGESPQMQNVFSKLSKVGPTDANVLILGENGTGKDLVAKALHQKSLRHAGPYVKVDVGALTESIFESELFGHKKGAFTDAREDRAGRFEAANSGTLFLDEIGNISLQQQAKLLTVLQNRQVTRLGSNTPSPIDIRLVCATNVPLAELANENRFRKDLIYRINTVEVIIPPLRQRKEDIGLLAAHFLQRYGDKYLKPDRELSPRALEKLQAYSFPGNVRELQYVIERAVIMADNRSLQPDDLVFSPLETPAPEAAGDVETKLSTIEKQTILKVVEKNNGNISKAAKELGITRTALYRRLSKYDI